jgi:hypothetical protein
MQLLRGAFTAPHCCSRALPPRVGSAAPWGHNAIPHARQRLTHAKAAEQSDESPRNLDGEDAAVFSLAAQTREQWTRFFIVLGVVMGVLVRCIRDMQ